MKFSRGSNQLKLVGQIGYRLTNLKIGDIVEEYHMNGRNYNHYLITKLDSSGIPGGFRIGTNEDTLDFRTYNQLRFVNSHYWTYRVLKPND